MKSTQEYWYKALSYRALGVAIADYYGKQMMRCPVHLSIGQEYWLPAVNTLFRHGDRVFSSHRSHSMYMALGGDIQKLIAELHGLDEGCVGGRGGSMHLKDIDVGLEASIPIVGSSLGLALGSALSHKRFSGKQKTLVHFGDGACEEGIFHEAINLAIVNSLPLVFLCENNEYSCNTNLQRRQSVKEMSRYVEHLPISCLRIDPEMQPDQVTGVMNSVGSKAEAGPVFLEIHSYRQYEHCGHRVDETNGDRTKEEYINKRDRDPIDIILRSDISYTTVFENYLNDYKEMIREIGGYR